MKIAILFPIIFGLCDSIELRRDSKYPPNEIVETLKRIHPPCRAQTGVDVAKIKEFSDNELNTIGEDEKLKCYMYCLFQAFGVTESSGEISLHLIRKKIPKTFKPIALKLSANCSKPIGESHCEKSYWLHKCWKNNDPQHYFLL